MAAKADWVAVDWGTSNLRVWGMDEAGRPVFERLADRGMARLAPGEFPFVLADLLADLLADAGAMGALDVLVCGMAGARQGWVEAPYLDLPADLGALGRASVPAPAPGQSFRVRIVPGVCRREAGREDVMRGEETQLLGVSVLRPGFAGLVLKAGTHSKWARLEGARLIDFSTAMTGELFEAASAHTVLRHSVGGEVMGPLTEEGIAAGLEAGLERPDLLTTLMFRARAAALVSERGPDWCSGYLSGLLVGAEVAGHRDEIGMGPVPVLGAERLTRLYRAALKRIGVETQPVEATEATLAGLAAVHKQIYATR